MRKGIFLCLFLLAFGAAKAADYVGVVCDSYGAPVPLVTVALLSADSSLLGGTTTADDGSFSVVSSQNVSLLRISCLGYQTIEQPVVWNTSDNQVDSLRFVLREETVVLTEVAVHGHQKLVERRMDKIVMNVASSAFAIGNNGKDILKKAPGVNIDRKGKITVNGKPVEVYIDGRPTYLSGEQLKTMLEGTDGSTIARVEIITQPSARYDAAGQGGIINIRTKRSMMRGVNGSLSAGYGGMYWRDIKQYMQEDHVSLNLNCRSEKTYTTLSFSQQYADHSDTFRSLTVSPEEQRSSQGHSRTKHQYYMLKLGTDWYVDSLNTLGFMFSTPLSARKSRNRPEDNCSVLMRGETILEKSTEEQSASERWLQHTFNIHYTHSFPGSLEQQLTISADYNRNNSHSLTHSITAGLAEIPFTEDVQQNNRHSTNLFSGRMDFESLFWQTGKIECGTKFFSTHTAYNSSSDTLSATSVSSAFGYTEQIMSLYTTLGKQFGDHWTTKLGLRGEFTRSVGNWPAEDSTFSRTYFNLFPSAFVSYMPDENWTVSLDYNRRIQRPNYTLLNPSVQMEDAHSLQKGNPLLKPSFTHNVLVSFGYSEYVSLDFDFAHTTDWMDYRINILPGGDRVLQATNYGTITSHGIHLSLTEVPIVPKLSARDESGHRSLSGAWLALTAQLGAMREHYCSYDNQLNMRHWVMDLYAELNAYLPHDWTLSLDGSYSTPSVWGTERLSSWKELNMAVKKDFPHQGLTLTARVNDLMLSSKWSSETLGLAEGYAVGYTGSDRAHSVSIGLSWKFGTMQEHRVSHAAETDSDRVGSKSGSRRK